MYIEVENVTKRYREQIVLSGISFGMEKGSIYGITGRNGSGKTVLMRCMCGYTKPDSGKIVIDSKIIGKDVEFPRSMGLMIGSPGFLSHFSAKENLEFLFDIRNRRNQNRNEMIVSALKKVGLDYKSRKPLSNYSLGMRQRLGIAQAIMENPDLLILDEPFNGLDSKGVENMRALLKTEAEKGTTIILSSHYPDDVRELCSNVIHLDGGSVRE